MPRRFVVPWNHATARERPTRMVVRTGCAIAAAAVLIVGGCGADARTAGSARVEDATDELDRARASWADADIASYTLSVAEDVNAWSAGCTWVVEVSDGIVTDSESARSSPTSSDCLPVQWTVEQLHQMVSGWIADVGRYPDPEFGQHTLDVRYDDFGVPEQLAFDLANGADEESSMRVTFEASP